MKRKTNYKVLFLGIGLALLFLFLYALITHFLPFKNSTMDYILSLVLAGLGFYCAEKILGDKISKRIE